MMASCCLEDSLATRVRRARTTCGRTRIMAIGKKSIMPPTTVLVLACIRRLPCYTMIYIFLADGTRVLPKVEARFWTMLYWRLNGTTMKWTLLDDKLPCGPVSRHAACTVGDNIIGHTFRGICTFDGDTWTEQATTGEEPEGLSMCAMTPLSDSSVLIFGGSTKTQQLSSDAFVLDTNTWEWTKVDTGGDDDDGPSPRASPCAAQWDDHQVIVFGGATLGSGGYDRGVGLQAQDDTWLFTTVAGDHQKARWDRIRVTGTSPNACLSATLSPTISGEELLLQGGWDPKGKTFEDTWVLKK